MQSMQNLLGQVAYLRRMCEVLLQRLDEVERLAVSDGQLDPMEHTQVEDATSRWCSPIKDHIELATKYAQEWHQQVEAVATARPR